MNDTVEEPTYRVIKSLSLRNKILRTILGRSQMCTVAWVEFFFYPDLLICTLDQIVVENSLFNFFVLVFAPMQFFILRYVLKMLGKNVLKQILKIILIFDDFCRLLAEDILNQRRRDPKYFFYIQKYLFCGLKRKKK